MSTHERQHERDLATMYHQMRREQEAQTIAVRPSRWAQAKKFVEAMGNGAALGSVLRRLTR